MASEQDIRAVMDADMGPREALAELADIARGAVARAETAERELDIMVPRWRARFDELDGEVLQLRARAEAAERELVYVRERSHKLVEQLRRDIGELAAGVVPYACAASEVVHER